MTAFSEKLRALIAERKISQNKLAQLVPCDAGHLSKVVNGHKGVSVELAQRLDDLLEASGKLVELRPKPPERRQSSQDRIAAECILTLGINSDVGDSVRRRAAIQLLTVLGANAGAAPLHRIADLLLTSAPRDLDGWHLACIDHLHAMRSRPVAQVREDVARDQIALGGQLDSAKGDGLTELQRVEAVLALLQAHLSAQLAEHGEAVRWYRTACLAADSSGDLDLRLMIRAREAGAGLYGQRDPGTVLKLIRQAERIAGDAPSFWRADLAGARAKALSLLGQHEQALEALNFSVEYGGPDKPTSILPTMWVSDQPLFTQSWVYAGAGNEAKADQARDLLLAHPANLSGVTPYAANVRLHEARCTITKGGIDQGVTQAAQVLDAMPAEHMTQFTTATGTFVLNAVPPEQRQRPAVLEFREVLASTAPKPSRPG
ncbi:helix-turn-helix domain-containing protein [Actinomadura terrae]|uniref:helix-turn-helix domain-containing protein n=1 Tax=Actinomadura terrae TaxID=604353 RepID=UPI001FA78499|nr:helix-turn-helix transcriptional regulator [Actinomadura terrae]